MRIIDALFAVSRTKLKHFKLVQWERLNISSKLMNNSAFPLNWNALYAPFKMGQVLCSVYFIRLKVARWIGLICYLKILFKANKILFIDSIHNNFCVMI